MFEAGNKGGIFIALKWVLANVPQHYYRSTLYLRVSFFYVYTGLELQFTPSFRILQILKIHLLASNKFIPLADNYEFQEK